MYSFQNSFIVLSLAAFTATPIFAETLDTDVYQACIATPEPSCLIALAEIERERYISTSSFEFEDDTWFPAVVEIELAIGDITGAAKHLSQMDPTILSWYFIDQYDEFPDLPTNIDASGVIRSVFIEVLEADPANFERLSIAMEEKSNVAWAMYIWGEKDIALDAFDRVVSFFEKSINGGDTEVVTAASDVLEAAIGMGEDETAAKIFDLLSRPEMAVKGYSDDWPGWTNKHVLRIYQTAQLFNEITDEENGPTGDTEPVDRYELVQPLEFALSLALDGKTSALIDFLRGLPLGNDQDSRDLNILLLVGELLDRDLPEIALMAAEETLDNWSRDTNLFKVASYHLQRGEMGQTEEILSRIIDPGTRATLLIRQARDLALSGEDLLARALLDHGIASLALVHNPVEQAFLHINTGLVFALLRDSVLARKMVDIGLGNVEGIMDSFLSNVSDMMTQYSLTVDAAVVLYIIGDGPEALTPIATLVGDDNADLVFGAILTAVQLQSYDLSDLAQSLVAHTIPRIQNLPEIDHEGLSFLYISAAEALVPDL